MARRTGGFGWVMAALLALAACEAGVGAGADDDLGADNPFLADQANRGKADTFYQNPDGVEVEVDLEGEIVADSWQIRRGPALLGQYAMTYLRNRGQFYLESLAEDASSPERVEWLVGEAWVADADVADADRASLARWRIRGVNAVLLHGAAAGVEVGTVFTAPVPLKPHTIYADAGEACADKDSHIGLSQSTYWYQWNPDKSGCQATLQDLTITVSRLFDASVVTWPEYDRLVADGRITVVVLFGLIGDEMSDTDTGFRGLNRMARWLTDAGFAKAADAPVGVRYTKTVAGVELVFDLYSPREFSGLSDMAHFGNFETALSEHEIVVYDGHSMLGASDFWSRPTYADGYQIFLYGGCLGYEYYVRPILEKKGGWDQVDIVSSVIEVSAGANEFAGPFLAKLIWALENDWQASWRDMLVAIRGRVGDSTFGVSGARDNCFTPTGSRCGDLPADPADVLRFEDAADAAIPDGSDTGVVRVIDVPEGTPAAQVTLDLAIAHPWVGDLRVTVEHGGAEVVVWDRTGGNAHDVRQRLTLDAFAGADAGGRWTLLVIDGAARDEGTLESWALEIVAPAE